MSGADAGDSGIVSGLANVALQVGAALGVALLAGVSSAQTDAMLQGGAPLATALTSGYRLGFLLGAAFALAAVVVGVGVLVLRTPRRERVVAVKVAARRQVANPAVAEREVEERGAVHQPVRELAEV